MSDNTPKFPPLYEKAQEALGACLRVRPHDHAKFLAAWDVARKAVERAAEVDECAEWTDKQAALECYARQAGDDSLLRMWRRIQRRVAREIRWLEQQPEIYLNGQAALRWMQEKLGGGAHG